MFESLSATKPDAILNLMVEYRADARGDKIDLGVGVYKDQEGDTPILGAVKQAESRLLDSQTSKTYVGPAGDMEFNRALGELVLAEFFAEARYAAVQTPGGSGAVRILCELVKRANPAATVWVSAPTWPNHLDILDNAGLRRADYAYFDAQTQAVDFEAMLASLGGAKPGDVVLLHGCCHNPTGVDLSLEQWQRVTDLVIERRLIPFVDLAYLGFGTGLAEDAAGLRHMAGRVDELLIAVSCSKNFGLYRERVGCAMAIGDAVRRDRVLETLKNIGRVIYSMPPDHGAALVRMILADTGLKADWLDELATMRHRLSDLRKQLAERLRAKAKSDRFAFVGDQQGMFSLIGATPEQVAELKQKHGIYVIGDGRINVAGLPQDRLDVVADAFLAVGM